MSAVKTNKKTFPNLRWLALGLGIVLVITYLATISHKDFEATIVDNFTSQQIVIVNTFQNLVMNYISESKQNLSSLSEDIKVHGVTPLTLEHISRTQEIHRDEFFSVGLLDEEGDYLFISPQVSGEDSSASTFVKKTVQNHKNMAEPFLSEKYITNQDQRVAYLFVPFALPDEKKYFLTATLLLEAFANNQLTSFDGSELCFFLADDDGDIYSILNAECEDSEMMENGNMFALDNSCLSCHRQGDFEDVRQSVDEGRIINTVYQYPTTEAMNRTTMSFLLFNETWTMSICAPYKLMQGAINKNARNNLIYSLLSIFVIGLLVYTSFRTKKRQAILEAEADNLRIIAQSAEGLRVSEERFKNISAMANDAILMMDNSEKISYWNTAAERIFGYTKKYTIGKDLHQLIVPSRYHDQFRKGFIGFLKNGQGAAIGETLELFAIRKDGEEFPVELSLSSVDIDGNWHAIGLIRDITKRKHAEKALQESNQMKEMLLDIITHDIKNPAGNIRNVVDMMLEGQTDNELLEIVKGSTNKLLQVMDNATILAQVATGEKIDMKESNLTEVLHSVAKEFSSQLNRSGMTLEVNLPDKLLVQANLIISEVFQNYISNAIKYATEGKKIIIDTEESDESLMINVKDSGTTIAEEHRQKIFERTYQIDGHKKGRGLGLSIVKKIAEAHNAEVGLKPNEPTGNIFYIRLPVKD